MYQLYYAPNNHYSSQLYTPSDSYTYPNYGTTRSEVNITTAVARIKGGPLAPDIKGTVTFKAIPEGTMVCISVTGLPPFKLGTETTLPIGPHGFHIHQNGTCEIGDPTKPFTAAGEHWNPTNQPHG